MVAFFRDVRWRRLYKLPGFSPFVCQLWRVEKPIRKAVNDSVDREGMDLLR